MTKFAYVIGTADTKREELLWIKSRLHLAGVDSHIIDVSTGPSAVLNENEKLDISAAQVAAYHISGTQAVFGKDRGKSIMAMSVALTNFLRSTVDDVSGIIGIGGSCGTHS